MASSAASRLPPPPPEKLAEQIRDFSAREEEIHFHTFTMASALEFLQLVGGQILPDIRLLEAVDARAEILLILQNGATVH